MSGGDRSIFYTRRLCLALLVDTVRLDAAVAIAA
jgi:hypothetical protein